MGYRGGSLVDLFRESTTDPPTTRLLRNVADAAGETMTTAAAAHTPKETGRVAERWRKLPVTRISIGTERAFESGTENPDWRARFLEYGTEAHAISPKTRKALGLPEGARAAADHPGIRPHGMTAKAANEVEASFEIIAAPHLHRWAEDIEANAAKHKGITKT